MRSTWKFVVACAAAGMLLAAAGCGSNGEDGGDSSTEANRGNTESAGNLSSEDMAGAIPATESRAPVHPVVLIETTMGNINIELDSENAPATVDNFLRYVDSGFYDQTIFHQVFPGAVIMGGALTPEFIAKAPGPSVNNEADNGLKNQRGTIAMFRDHDIIDSATCQFFINAKNNPNYDFKPGARETYDNPQDYGYCVFGRVSEESMSVVDEIADVEVHDTADFDQTPVRTVLIKSISRIR